MSDVAYQSMTKAKLIARVVELKRHMDRLLNSHADLTDYASGKVEGVNVDWSEEIEHQARQAHLRKGGAA